MKIQILNCGYDRMWGGADWKILCPYKLKYKKIFGKM